MICGSNKETYENLCQLMEDANERGEKITIEREGPCKGGTYLTDGAAVVSQSNSNLEILVHYMIHKNRI